MIASKTPLLLGFNGPSTVPDADTLEVVAALLGAEFYQAILMGNVTLQRDDYEYVGRRGSSNRVPGVTHLRVEGQGCGELRTYEPLRGVQDLRKACRAAFLKARGSEAFLEFRERMAAKHPSASEELIADAWEQANPAAAKEVPKPVAPRIRRAIEKLAAARVFAARAGEGKLNDALEQADLLLCEAMDRYEAEGCSRVEEFRAKVLKFIEDATGEMGGIAKVRVKALRERVAAAASEKP